MLVELSLNTLVQSITITGQICMVDCGPQEIILYDYGAIARYNFPLDQHFGLCQCVLKSKDWICMKSFVD